MSYLDRSPISSPARKKRKLDFSSPVCPELELSLEDLHALDEIEFRLSQSSHPSSQSPSKPYPTENPFHAPNPAPAFLGFSAASAIAISHDDSAYVDRSSPDPPEEKDYSAWFESSGIPTIDGSQTTVAFTSASAMSSTPLFSSASALMDEQRSSALGFRTVGKGAGLLIPSAVALAKAEETLKQWQEEEAQQEESPHTSSAQSRSPLRTVQHRMPEPETPCPPSHSLGFASASQLSKGFTRPSSKSSSFVSPLINKTKSQNTDPNRPRPFKPPTLNTPVTPAQSSSSAAPAFTSARSQHPLAAPPFNATPARTRGDNISSDSTPCVASSSISYQHHTERSAHIFVTPVRRESNSNLAHAQSAGRIRTTPAKFVTPFKKGMRPGEAGRAELEARQKLQQPPRTPMKSMFRDFASGKIPKDQSLQMPRVFDLTPPPNRLSLQDSGLLPQQYTAEEMSSYGM
ncbi:hypothetical protein GYMLUDRAFT_285923 [Collybiopsis luxurians FD-317 M1]|nr:hypothetical protein GYMLUDRAFT_285923 [Collybiopsis luxurians FD-317 M1]